MGAANKLYNGNIAETFWSTATDGGFVRNYGYKYDNLNRLKDATYQKSGQLTGMYNENLSYDKNGNIMNLSRYGDRDEQYLPIQIDNLGYNYGTNSNQLKSVTDATNNTSGFKDGNTTGDDYVYDANGNMTVDKNKNITSIVYNHLNLPTKIIFPTGNIVYIYTASGQKMQKIVTNGTNTTTTDYLGGYQYQNTVLQFLPTAEGYVKNTPVSGTNTYSYVYNYTDHLGNVRLSYTKNPSTNALTILEENNYYPFGLKHNSYNVDNFQPGYKYKYNGKELQEELGLNIYDYGARNYDPALGRWMNVDPLAELAPNKTPYHFVSNNPINRVDPTGLTDYEVNGKTHTINDGHDDVSMKVTQREFNRLQRRFDRGGGGYERLMNRLSNDNGFKTFGTNGEAYTDAGGTHHLQEVSITTHKANSGSYADFKINEGINTGLNNTLGAVGLGNDIKTNLIAEAGKLSELSKGAQNYLKVAKGLGVAGSIVTTGYSVGKVINEHNLGGWSEVAKHRDVYDAGVGAIGLGATGLAYFGLISNPVGWTIGAGVLIYGGATMIYDAVQENKK